MSTFRVVLEKTVTEYYIVDADDEESATMIAEQESVQPVSSEEVSSTTVDVEEVQ